MRPWILACLALSTPILHAAPELRLQIQEDGLDLQARHFKLELSRPAPLEITCDAQDGSGERHRLTRTARDRRPLLLRGLKASTRYSCRAEVKDGSGRRSGEQVFITAPLPSDLTAPGISVAAKDLAKTGYTLYNYGVSGRFGYSANYLVIIDAEGTVRWYYRGPYRGGVGGGDVDATWLGGDRILYGGDINRNFPPTIVGLDKRIQFETVGQTTSPTDLPTEYGHDVGISSDGKSIFYTNGSNIAGVGSTADDDTTFVMGFVLKQLDPATDKVTWSWDSVQDGFAPGGLPDPGAPYSSEYLFSNDPYHVNSISDQWEDGRLYLYVGLRNNNTIIKIDHETKAVVWTLGMGGDFTLLEPDGREAADDRWFFNQHDAQIYGKTLVMYDNGWDRQLYGAEPYTRALRLELDEQAMTARIVYEYTEPGWLEGIFGGHDLLPDGNSLVAMGHTTFSTAGHRSAIVELDSSGRVVWRADFKQLNEVIYRADRIPGCAAFNDVRYCP